MARVFAKFSRLVANFATTTALCCSLINPAPGHAAAVTDNDQLNFDMVYDAAAEQAPTMEVNGQSFTDFTQAIQAAQTQQRPLEITSSGTIVLNSSIELTGSATITTSHEVRFRKQGSNFNSYVFRVPSSKSLTFTSTGSGQFSFTNDGTVNNIAFIGAWRNSQVTFNGNTLFHDINSNNSFASSLVIDGAFTNNGTIFLKNVTNSSGASNLNDGGAAGAGWARFSTASTTQLGTLNADTVSGRIGGAVVNQGNLTATAINTYNTTGVGGGVLANFGTATIDKLNVSVSQANYGGALLASAGQLTVNSGQVHGAFTSGQGNGGVLFARGTGRALLKDTDLSDSTNRDYWGLNAIAIEGTGPQVTLDNSDLGQQSISLINQAKINFVGHPVGVSATNPLRLNMDGGNRANENVDVATFDSAAEAEAAIGYTLIQHPAGPRFVTLSETHNTIKLDLLVNNERLTGITNPYNDKLGYQVKEAYNTPAKLDQLMLEINTKVLDPAIRKQYLAQAELLKEYLPLLADETYLNKLKQTEIQLSQRGNMEAERNRTRSWMRLENADATGLAMKQTDNPSQLLQDLTGDATGNRVALAVWIDAPENTSVGLGYRHAGLGTAQSSWNTVIMRETALHPGYNLVILTANAFGSDSSRTFDNLYLRNHSTNPVRARIMAADAFITKDAAIAPAFQPASSAPLSLGTQLVQQPAFIYTPGEPEHGETVTAEQTATAAAQKERYPDWYRFLVQQCRAYPNLGPEVQMNLFVSAGTCSATLDSFKKTIGRDRRGNPIKELRTDEEIKQMLEQATRANSHRLNVYRQVDGQSFTDPNPVHRPSPMLHVIDGSPGGKWLWATNTIIHGDQGITTSVNQGEGQGGWGLNHESGHQLDNNWLGVVEVTNNIYSVYGGLDAFSQSNTTGLINRSIAQSYEHGAYIQAQDTFDGIVNKMIAGEVDPALKVNDPGFYWISNWPDTYDGVWQRLALTVNISQFFDSYDYANYPWQQYGNVYSDKYLADIKQYSLWGAIARRIREGDLGAWNEATMARVSSDVVAKYPFTSKGQTYTGLNNDSVVRIRRTIAMLTQTSGFNICKPFNMLGFTYEMQGPNLVALCNQYPLPPVPLEYRGGQDVVQSMVDPATVPALTATPTVTNLAAVTGGTRITLGLSDTSQLPRVRGFEIYRDGKLVGFTRRTDFVDTTAGNSTTAKYTVRAFGPKLESTSTYQANATLTGTNFVVHITDQTGAAVNPSEPLRITKGALELNDWRTTSTGVYSGTLTKAPSGTTQIEGTGGNVTLNTTLTFTPGRQSTATLPSSGTRGHALNFSGVIRDDQGIILTNAPVTVRCGTKSATTTSNSAGEFSVSCIPDVSGQITVSVTSGNWTQAGSATISQDLTPAKVLATVAGNQLTVQVQNQYGDVVTGEVAVSGVRVGAVASKNGTVTYPITETSYGDHDITVSAGTATATTSYALKPVAAQSEVTIPQTVTNTAAIQVTGTARGPQNQIVANTPISVTCGTGQPVTTTTNDQGTFSTTCAAHSTAETITVTVKNGDDILATGQTSITVDQTPAKVTAQVVNDQLEVTVTNSNGDVLDSEVKLSGIQLGAATSTTGTRSYPITETAYGNHVITVTAGAATATTSYTVKPTANQSEVTIPQTATNTSPLQVTGTARGPQNQIVANAPISVTCGTAEPVTTTTNDKGTFSATCAAHSTAETITVTVKSGDTTLATGQTIITVDQTPAKVAAQVVNDQLEVTVTNSNGDILADTPVTITGIQTGTPQTATNGTASYPIIETVYGNHNITVTAGVASTTTSYTVKPVATNSEVAIPQTATNTSPLQVTGTARGPQNQIVANAPVSVTCGTGQRVTTTTNSQGTFSTTCAAHSTAETITVTVKSGDDILATGQTIITVDQTPAKVTAQVVADQLQVTVTNSNGDILADAPVTINGIQTGTPQTATNGTVSYPITESAYGDHDITVTAGIATATTSYTVKPTAGQSEVTIPASVKARDAITITGTLRSSTGQVVSNAPVTVICGEVTVTTNTGAAGTFSATCTHPGIPGSVPVAVQVAEQRLAAESTKVLSVTDPARISAEVTGDLLQVIVFNQFDEPLPQARVNITGLEVRNQATSESEQQTYTILTTTAGSHEATISAGTISTSATYVLAPDPQHSIVNITPAQVTAGQQLTVSGTLYGPQNQLVVGAPLTLTCGSTTVTGSSGTGGKFALTCPAGSQVGDLTVLLHSDQLELARKTIPVIFDEQPASISAVVTGAVAEVTVKNALGELLPDATIKAAGAEVGNPTTTAQGTVAFPLTETRFGPHELSFTAGSVATTVTFTITPAAAASTVTIPATVTAGQELQVSGIVRSEGGLPVAQAPLTLTCADHEVTRVSGADGKFSIPCATPNAAGQLDIQVAAAQLQLAQSTVQVTQDQTAAQVTATVAADELVVHVFNKFGELLPAAEVTVTGAEVEAAHREEDGSIRFAITETAAGTHHLTIAAGPVSTTAEYAVAVSVADSEISAPQTAAAGQEVQITGILRTASKRPVSGAKVQARCNGTELAAQTDEHGAFTLKCQVTSGSQQLTASLLNGTATVDLAEVEITAATVAESPAESPAATPQPIQDPVVTTPEQPAVPAEQPEAPAAAGSSKFWWLPVLGLLLALLGAGAAVATAAPR